MEQLEELEYHRIHRAGAKGVWRPLVGVSLVALWFVVLGSLVAMLPFVVWFLASGEPVLDGLQRMIDVEDPDPVTIAYINVTLGSAIFATWFVQVFLHGIKPRWLSSVHPRLRLGYLFACLPLAVVALGATLLVAMAMPESAAGMDLSGPQPFTSTTQQFIIVIILLTPFQAAAEEYVFRGYLTQAIGGIFASKALAVLLPALLFALAHGLAQGWPIFMDRFAFGIVAGVLVLRTGGLEAAIAMHVLNNFVAFGLALAFSDLGTALNATGGSWWSLPSTLTQSLVYLGLAIVVAKAMKIRSTVPPPQPPALAPGGVLEGPRGRV